MVSLRSGSVTDHHEADDQPEIISKRNASRQRAKARTVKDTLPQPKVLSTTPLSAAGPNGRRTVKLPAIAEAFPGVAQMTEEEEFEAVQHEAEAAAEVALHSSKKATDTPARNTRARRRIPALPTPLALGAPRRQAQDNQQLETAQEDSSGPSAAEQPSPESSGMGSHPGLCVRTPGSQLSDDVDLSDGSEHISNLQSSPLMDAAVAEPKRQHAEAENESRPQPHVETQDSEHADASASSSGWSSDEDETDEASALGQMAQSMLAALRSSQQRAPYTTLPAGAPQQRVQSRDRGHGGTRPGALHASRPAAVEKEAGGEIKVAEVHWEPAVQLPALQFADADKIEDILRKVEPVPTGQLVAPSRDARRIAREVRKAAPDTAGSNWFDLPATQITDEVKRDLRLLRLRGVMDPKRFYKSVDQSKFPKYFQFGTVVEGPTEFYSGRMTKKERKQTLTEELLADPELTQSRRKRFGVLQQEKQRWSRKKRRPTNNERKKVYKRPRR